MFDRNCNRSCTDEGNTTCEHLIEDYTKRINVRVVIRRIASSLFWRKIFWCSYYRTSTCKCMGPTILFCCVFQYFGEAKICDENSTIGMEKNVAWLQMSVNDTQCMSTV